MATLLSITISIADAINDDSYINFYLRVNAAINAITGGIRMPEGIISPPLPELYEMATVSTTSNAYADLPATYQRNMFMIVDSNGDRIHPPRGGTYYDFMLFLKQIEKKDLSEAGSVYRGAVKGKRLYYQGIPGATETLTIHFYRLPVDIHNNDDEPDGIPSHLAVKLIKNYVCKEIFAEKNDAQVDKYNNLFYEAMRELIDFVGEPDREPVYYGQSTDFIDAAICD